MWREKWWSPPIWKKNNSRQPLKILGQTWSSSQSWCGLACFLVYLIYYVSFFWIINLNTFKLTCITDWKVSKLAKTLRRNIKWGEKELAKKNVNHREVPCVIDASAGQQKQVTIDKVPTITKSRGSGKNSSWETSQRRFLTVPELAKLQGFDYKKLKFDKDVPLTAQGGMIGNAMSLPVLKFVMKRALLAAGMMKK